MAEEYDKLVRDDIPSVIRENGEQPVVSMADGEEYRQRLVDKLFEEVEEYAESEEVEELVDILEVVRALSEVDDVSPEELEERREEKAAERGGFSEGVVLESVLK